MTATKGMPTWVIEYGIRNKGPQDADYDPSSSWVQRVYDGTARFMCGGHLDTGWKPVEEVRETARAHLAEHGYEIPGERLERERPS